MRSSRFLVFAAALAMAAAAGCTPGGVGPGSPSYAPGTLGNGGFSFQCDDSVACNKYNGSASVFPDRVAEGSTFRVQYIPKDTTLHINEVGPGQGVTLGAVGSTFFSYGPDGYAAVKAGYGTITARNAQGSLVEFITLPIAHPDAVVVYDADYSGTTPAPVTAVAMKVGDRKSFRTLARQKGRDLAGAFNSEWTPNDPTITDVESYTGGKATILAKKAGTTTFTVAGAALTRQIAFEVTP